MTETKTNDVVGAFVRYKNTGPIYSILEDRGDVCLVQTMFGKGIYSTHKLMCDECRKPIRECVKCESCKEYHCDGKCQVCEFCDGTGVNQIDEYENGQCVGVGTLETPCICTFE